MGKVPPSAIEAVLSAPCKNKVPVYIYFLRSVLLNACIPVKAFINTCSVQSALKWLSDFEAGGTHGLTPMSPPQYHQTPRLLTRELLLTTLRHCYA